MKRLVYVCEDRGIALDGAKGSSVHARSMIRAFADAGIEVVAISPRIGDVGWASGLPVSFLPLPKEGACSLLDALHEERPVDAVYERLSLRAAGASRWRRANGVAHWVEVNAPLVEEAAQYRGLENVERAREIETEVLRHADLLLPVSPWLHRWLIELGCDDARIHTLPNGVAREWLAESSRVGAGRRTDGKTTIGFVGSLRPWHGLETLLSAVERLPADRFRLLIVGDGPMRDWLKRRMSDRALTDRVEWAGRVSAEAMPDLIDAMDICVAPYDASDRFYFCPIKIFEYGARCRPVVTADLPELREQFSAKALRFCPPGDADAMARALVELDDNRREAAQLARRLHNYVSRHTWDRHAAQALVWGGIDVAATEAVG